MLALQFLRQYLHYSTYQRCHNNLQCHQYYFDVVSFTEQPPTMLFVTLIGHGRSRQITSDSANVGSGSSCACTVLIDKPTLNFQATVANYKFIDTLVLI